MSPVLDWSIHFITWLQTGAPWLFFPARLFSFVGTEEFYLFILPLLYWCVDMRVGLRVGVILTVSDSLNTFFKFVFHQPRPFWVSDRVRALGAEGSYGLPSGHAQHGMTVWGTIAAAAKGRLRWFLAMVIFLIGFSRIVLAVHFPTDVLAGWLIGGLILWAFLRWESPVIAWFNRFSLTQKVALVFSASMLLLAVSLSGLAFVPGEDPLQWEVTAGRALSFPPGVSALHPRSTIGIFGVAGTFFGFVIGAVLMFQRGGFDARGIWWKRVLRFLLGLIGATALWAGLRILLPRDTSLFSQVLRYIRYAFAGFWITYAAPWIFIKLGLQNAPGVPDQGGPRSEGTLIPAHGSHVDLK